MATPTASATTATPTILESKGRARDMGQLAPQPHFPAPQPQLPSMQRQPGPQEHACDFVHSGPQSHVPVPQPQLPSVHRQPGPQRQPFASVAVFPVAATAAMSACASTPPAASTVAFFFSRSTLALTTPSTLVRALVTLLTQPPQVMPSEERQVSEDQGFNRVVYK